MCSPPSIALLFFVTGIACGVYPSTRVSEQERKSTVEANPSTLRDTATPIHDPPTSCSCGSPGPWRRMAYLNMSDPDQKCPPKLFPFTTPVRVCGRSPTSSGPMCDSAVFPSNGTSYSHVCGRITALQFGGTVAFYTSISHGFKLGDSYVSGVSLTHGSYQQHIWTFAAAIYENDPKYNLQWVCPCTNTKFNWSYSIPSFVGKNYFCDTGNPGPGITYNEIYSDDPLWDGEGCGPTDTCCRFNDPPWFCTTLPQPTKDDMELRICGFESDNVYIRFVDIYVM